MIADRTPLGPLYVCWQCGWPESPSAAVCRFCGTPPRDLSDRGSEASVDPEAVGSESLPDRASEVLIPLAAVGTTTASPGLRFIAPTEVGSPAAAAESAELIPTIVDVADLIVPRVPCTRCGNSISEAARFCHDCGTRRSGPLWRPTVGSPGSALSAERTLSKGQMRVIIGGVAIVGLLLLLAPLATLTVGIGLATALYLASLVYRLLIFRAALDEPGTVVVDDAEAYAIPSRQLPTYTILVPAYREPEVIAGLLASLSRLDYPDDRLDIKLLLEADDPDTLAAVFEARPNSNVEVVRILPSEPRTKPKACNVGLGRAQGMFVTIYDAEDRPDPLQLRRAVAAFRRMPPEVACLQAKLSYHNAEQNLLTRWFTVEYALWFGQWLPGLVKLGAPVPLGGTSNHFRRETLVRLGGWDAFNVTEDADLGIRLHRLGFRTRVLESITFEEANSDFVNWTKQRSRWYKGYLQTWLVHMRRPRLLLRQLGPRGFVGFNLFVGGTPALALLNPLFWALTGLWFLAKPPVILALFPPWLYYASLGCLVLGNFAFLYTAIVGARITGRPSLVFAAVLIPGYWVMMSIAAIKAMSQLVAAPAFWEKTVHGLDRMPASRSVHDTT
jgi:glycosyltransferase XagB